MATEWLNRQNCHTKNVAMAVNFNTASRELSNCASPNSLSQIEVEIKWFVSLTLAVSFTVQSIYTENLGIVWFDIISHKETKQKM